MPKQIRLNSVDMKCVAHQSLALWAHPRDRADHYNTLDYWVELARIFERGKFDALFLADVLGTYDVNRGSPDTAIANAVRGPVNDPLLLIPAMAYVTRNLGLALHARSRTNTPTRWRGVFRRSIT
jgi:long-chain alkane monooxygenase